MSVLEGEEVEAGGGVTGPTPWEWSPGPGAPALQPSDLLSGFGDDPRRWPNRFDLDRLGRISTEQWANDYCWRDTFDGKAEETWGEWSTTWPLPIGRRAIFQAFPPSERHRPAPFANAMPWPGWEYAGFIITADVGANTVTTFCLLDRNVDASRQGCDPVVWFSKGEIHFVLHGADPTGPAVSSYVEHARAWWTGFAAPKVGAGRPLGSTVRSLTDYQSIFRLFYGEELRPPTRDEFVARSDIPETTVKRNLRGWGYT